MKLTARELPRRYWQRIAEKNGIPPALFRQRLHIWGDAQRAATQPRRHVSHRPINPESRLQKLKRAGLHKNAIHAYLRTRPDCTLTDDEIIERLKARTKTRSVASLAREAGLKADTVRDRLERGWSMDEALSRRPMNHREAGKIRAAQMWPQRQGEMS